MAKERHPVFGLRIDPKLVAEFKKVAKNKGYNNTEALEQAMQRWLDNQ